jgi:hypothetical protein
LNEIFRLAFGWDFDDEDVEEEEQYWEKWGFVMVGEEWYLKRAMRLDH